jgi:Ca-activated chloride channel family protein
VTFGSPIFLLGLLLVPLVVAAYVAGRRRARRYAVRFTALPALKLAGGAVPAWRRHLPAALALAALVSLVVAVAKPQRSVAVPTQEGSIMLVTDHSRSMEATDVRPSRLSAAQDAARTFIRRLPSVIRVGVVAFSDAPDAVQGPTQSHDDARRIIDGQVADGATDTGDALQVAIDLLRQTRPGTKRPPAAIVLLSDGKTTTGRDPIAVARAAGKLRIPIYTVSLGTSEGVIPYPGFGGGLVPVAPDPATLRHISQASGGRAFTAESSDRLSSIYQSLGSQLGTRQQRHEITAAFAIVGLALLAAGAAASLRGAGRLP